MIVLLVAGWCAGAALLWRWPTVPRAAGGTGVGRRRVSVVVPARDEATRVGALLRSLDGQADEVIVVDDESSDGTATVAADLGATVVQSGGPPPGWNGKPWACAVGVEHATGDLLVLLDADTWVRPDAIARLAAAYDDLADGGLLSVQPFHVTERWFEQASAFPNVVAAMGRGVAFGPCLVTTPQALVGAGGFAAVSDEVVEDVALARAFRRAGRPVRRLGGGDAVQFRMYDTPGALFEGWTKNLAAGARRASTVSTALSALWVTAAAASVVRPLAYVAFAVQLGWILRRLGRFRAWTWIAFPLPLAAFVVLFVTSLLRRRVRWRGRVLER